MCVCVYVCVYSQSDLMREQLHWPTKHWDGSESKNYWYFLTHFSTEVQHPYIFCIKCFKYLCCILDIWWPSKFFLSLEVHFLFLTRVDLAKKSYKEESTNPQTFVEEIARLRFVLHSVFCFSISSICLELEWIYIVWSRCHKISWKNLQPWIMKPAPSWHEDMIFVPVTHSLDWAAIHVCM